MPALPTLCQKPLGDMRQGLNSYDFHTKGDGHKSHCSQQPPLVPKVSPIKGEALIMGCKKGIANKVASEVKTKPLYKK